MKRVPDGPKIFFRIANREDAKDLRLWRNNAKARENSFNAKIISWQEHRKWFYSKIKDPDTKIYIAVLGKYKIGVIRFEIKNSFAKVSIALNPRFFNKGLGSGIIKLGVNRFISETNIDKPVFAEIRKDNIASQKAFSKAGFIFREEDKKKAIYIYRSNVQAKG